MDFIDKSYAIHADTYSEVSTDKDLVEKYTNWLDKNTTDVWRHQQMLSCLDPLLEFYPAAAWITIGDGMFGTSCSYIEKKGANCLATDIDTRLLEKSVDLKWIKAMKFENAESISFQRDTFDFAFCKEAFHHFPRPYLGLYEMIRISRKAVVLTEPSDWIPGPILKQLMVKGKRLVKRLIGKTIHHTDTGNFEEIGNYVFTISIREFEKIGMAMGLPAIAFRRFHDVYYPGVEEELLTGEKILWKKIKRQIKRNQILTSIGLSSKNRVSVIIFKELPPLTLIEQLKRHGFTITLLPSNPAM